MEKAQEIRPEVTQDLVLRLTKEITDLRNENAQLQVKSDRVLPNVSPSKMT